MTPDAAMERINRILAHAWMVRQFLKHADEVQEDEDMLDVHRMIFDYLRAVEPSYQRRTRKSTCTGRAANCPSCGRWRSFSSANIVACRIIPTSRWPRRR